MIGSGSNGQSLVVLIGNAAVFSFGDAQVIQGNLLNGWIMLIKLHPDVFLYRGGANDKKHGKPHP